MSWGLVLSGGAALGISNAGVIERLEEEGLRPDCIAGSSMGAIVGALYALGLPTSAFRKVISQIKLNKLAKLSDKPLKQGLHGGILRQRINELLSPLIGDAIIADCKIPFVCIAGKIKEPIKWEKMLGKGFTPHVMECAEKYIFPPDTKLIDALTASSAIPVIFSPVKIGEDSFIDLCTFGAIPARTLKEELNPDVIIATNTTPHYSIIKRFAPASLKEFIAASHQSREESKAQCDLIIEPNLDFSIIRFDKGEEFIDAGRDAVDGAMERLKELIVRK
ncbi:patatin-like phospholipase family protein [Patescibacteria group bacterium]|nr:patatin-like phospholipase family protein [Patescibacteria group bacterium]MBU1910867.1 patatin-like phospholipase family protein [Patescibacteria group bacterium]